MAEYKKGFEDNYKKDKRNVTLVDFIVEKIEASQTNTGKVVSAPAQMAMNFRCDLRSYKYYLIAGLFLYIFWLLLIGYHYVTQDAIQAKDAKSPQNQLTSTGALKTLESRQEQLHKDMTLLVEKQASSEKQLSQKVTQVSEDITLIKSALENINSELLQKKAAVILQNNKELQNPTNK